jgi:4-hydroxy-tetrahydrodipicolinate reductase
MIHVVVTGVAGRMSSQIIRMIRDTEGMSLSGATERPGTAAVGLDAGLAAGLGLLEVDVRDDLTKVLGAKADVVVDFTSFEASVHHAEVCAEHGVALVVGSTGFTAEAKEKVRAAAKRVPIVMSPNMSVSVSLMFQLARSAARTLGPGWDVEILELHHRKKKDAPSGTAMRLAEIVAQDLGRDPAKDFALTRAGLVGERPPDQIGIQALRGGDVVGEHTIYFIADGERVEITHRATSRDQFARGAVRAAQWVVGKPAGLYDMQHVLGFEAVKGHGKGTP